MCVAYLWSDQDSVHLSNRGVQFDSRSVVNPPFVRKWVSENIIAAGFLALSDWLHSFLNYRQALGIVGGNRPSVTSLGTRMIERPIEETDSVSAGRVVVAFIQVFAVQEWQHDISILSALADQLVGLCRFKNEACSEWVRSLIGAVRIRSQTVGFAVNSS